MRKLYRLVWTVMISGIFLSMTACNNQTSDAIQTSRVEFESIAEAEPSETPIPDTGLTDEFLYEQMQRIAYYGETDSAMSLLASVQNNAFAKDIATYYSDLLESCTTTLESDIAKGMLTVMHLISNDLTNGTYEQVQVLNVWTVNYEQATQVTSHTNDAVLELKWRSSSADGHGFFLIQSYTSPETIQNRVACTEKVEAHRAAPFISGSALPSTFEYLWNYTGIDRDAADGVTQCSEEYAENSGLYFRKLSSNEFENLNTILNHPIYREFLSYQPIFDELTSQQLAEQAEQYQQPQQPEKEDPHIGMTADEVRNSTWGSPREINRTTSIYGTREQWVYRKGYIYFEDGIVTTIQEKLD